VMADAGCLLSAAVLRVLPGQADRQQVPACGSSARSEPARLLSRCCREAQRRA
jgi:hypothetical protein